MYLDLVLAVILLSDFLVIELLMPTFFQALNKTKIQISGSDILDFKKNVVFSPFNCCLRVVL